MLKNKLKDCCFRNHDDAKSYHIEEEQKTMENSKGSEDERPQRDPANSNGSAYTIYTEGDTCAKDSEVYFVVDGMVQLSSCHSKTQYIVRTGSFFGERELFFDRDKWHHTFSKSDQSSGVEAQWDKRRRQHTAKVISKGMYSRWILASTSFVAIVVVDHQVIQALAHRFGKVDVHQVV